MTEICDVLVKTEGNRVDRFDCEVCKISLAKQEEYIEHFWTHFVKKVCEDCNKSVYLIGGLVLQLHDVWNCSGLRVQKEDHDPIVEVICDPENELKLENVYLDCKDVPPTTLNEDPELIPIAKRLNFIKPIKKRKGRKRKWSVQKKSNKSNVSPKLANIVEVQMEPFIADEMPVPNSPDSSIHDRDTNDMPNKSPESSILDDKSNDITSKSPLYEPPDDDSSDGGLSEIDFDEMEDEKVPTAENPEQIDGPKKRGRKRQADSVKWLKNTPCDLCNQRFRNDRVVQRHKKLKHGIDIPLDCRDCQICGKKLASYLNWRRHMTLHTGIRELMCSYCGVGFHTKRKLEDHVNLHEGVTPYSCDVCGKKFSTTNQRYAHAKVHGERNYICEVEGCGARYKHASNILRHRKEKHLPNAKIYACPICPKQFKERRHLLVLHMRIHAKADTVADASAV